MLIYYLGSARSYMVKAQVSQRELKTSRRKKKKALKSKLIHNESKLDKFVTQISKVLFYQIKISNEQGQADSNETAAFNEAEFLPSLNLISSSGSFAGKLLYPVYLFNLNEINENSNIQANQKSQNFENGAVKSSAV